MRTTRRDEIKWLAANIAPLASVYLGSLTCVFLSSLLVLIDPLVMKWLIDSVIPRRDAKWLMVAVGLFLITHASRLFIDGVGLMVGFQAVQKMLFRIRLDLLRRLQCFSAEYHTSKPVGDTLHRLERDVDQIGEVGGQFMLSLLRMVTLTFFILIMMSVLNVRLTCIVVGLIPAFLIVRHHFHGRLRRCSDIAQEQSAEVSSFLEKNFAPIVQIQILSREMTEA